MKTVLAWIGGVCVVTTALACIGCLLAASRERRRRMAAWREQRMRRRVNTPDGPATPLRARSREEAVSKLLEEVVG